jgi:hypothetical protein
MVAIGATLPVVDMALLNTAIEFVFWLETYRRVVGAAGVGVAVGVGVGEAVGVGVGVALPPRVRRGEITQPVIMNNAKNITTASEISFRRTHPPLPDSCFLGFAAHHNPELLDFSRLSMSTKVTEFCPVLALDLAGKTGFNRRQRRCGQVHYRAGNKRAAIEGRPLLLPKRCSENVVTKTRDYMPGFLSADAASPFSLAMVSLSM